MNLGGSPLPELRDGVFSLSTHLDTRLGIPDVSRFCLAVRLDARPGRVFQHAAVSSVRAHNTACFMYLTAYGGYPPSLASLGSPPGGSLTSATAADLLDSVLASGSKSGYTFTYTVVADPIRRGATGQRGFFTDQTGAIRANPTGTADANSTPIS